MGGHVEEFGTGMKWNGMNMNTDMDMGIRLGPGGGKQCFLGK